MKRLTDEQRRVLMLIRRRGSGTPESCKCRVPTFVALAERKLIYVGTTLASICFPRTSARAEITKEGRAALRRS